MGCSPIYLMGLDHDWLAHRGQDTHFFSGRSIENHETATGELCTPYDADMQALWKLWQGYRKLKSLAEARGIRILNATAGGFLDVFERLDYKSLFGPALTGRSCDTNTSDADNIPFVNVAAEG